MPRSSSLCRSQTMGTSGWTERDAPTVVRDGKALLNHPTCSSEALSGLSLTHTDQKIPIELGDDSIVESEPTRRRALANRRHLEHRRAAGLMADIVHSPAQLSCIGRYLADTEGYIPRLEPFWPIYGR